MFVGVVLAINALLRRLPLVWLQGTVRWAVPYGIGALASYWMLERVHVLIR